MGIEIHVAVPRASVVLAEVQEGGAAEAGGELPVAPDPRLAVIGGPGEL